MKVLPGLCYIKRILFFCKTMEPTKVVCVFCQATPGDFLLDPHLIKHSPKHQIVALRSMAHKLPSLFHASP